MTDDTTTPVADEEFTPTTDQVRNYYVEGRLSIHDGFQPTGEEQFNRWLASIRHQTITDAVQSLDDLRESSGDTRWRDRLLRLAEDYQPESSDENGVIDSVAFERDHWKTVASNLEAIVAQVSFALDPDNLPIGTSYARWWDRKIVEVRAALANAKAEPNPFGPKSKAPNPVQTDEWGMR